MEEWSKAICDECSKQIEAFIFAKATGERLCLDCARKRETDLPLRMEIKRSPDLGTAQQ